ncbi:hypothetical protein GYMLUDRAFT_1025507 [Collybiopsis luxurians FD-317 M1]|nr:hypothetical protein GYMLUDRAFT_1025507 [Collybiopsis luxurians FD-317 M1]
MVIDEYKDRRNRETVTLSEKTDFPMGRKGCYFLGEKPLIGSKLVTYETTITRRHQNSRVRNDAEGVEKIEPFARAAAFFGTSDVLQQAVNHKFGLSNDHEFGRVSINTVGHILSYQQREFYFKSFRVMPSEAMKEHKIYPRKWPSLLSSAKRKANETRDAIWSGRRNYLEDCERLSNEREEWENTSH